MKGNNVNRSSKDKKKTSVGESTGEDAAWKRELLNDTSASGGSRFIVASFSFVVLSPPFLFPLCPSLSLPSGERDQTKDREGRGTRKGMRIRNNMKENSCLSLIFYFLSLLLFLILIRIPSFVSLFLCLALLFFFFFFFV